MSFSKKYLPDKYYVEVGKDRKASYKSKYVFNRYTIEGTSNEVMAFNYYHGTNCGNGYKKRLIRVTSDGEVFILARFQSI